jgi:hypothetical protein
MTAVERINMAFVDMHRNGARRACASTFVLSQTFKVNGLDARLSIIAAISSMGGEHAPLIQAYFVLKETLDNPKKIQEIVSRYDKRRKIPGFGSGFIKGEPDPIHAEIDALIKELSPKTHYWMTELHHAVQDSISPKLFMNTAIYSAAVAILLNFSPYVLPGLVIESRLMVWNQIMAGILNESNKEKTEPS